MDDPKIPKGTLTLLFGDYFQFDYLRCGDFDKVAISFSDVKDCTGRGIVDAF